MFQSITAEYERRRTGANGEYARAQVSGDRYRIAAIIAAVLTARALWDVVEHTRGLWSLAAMAAITIGVMLLLFRSRGKAKKAWRLAALYGRGLQRVLGEDALSGSTGESFSKPGHLYARDLDVVGRNSIFDHLATTRTKVGQRGLARLLLLPVSSVEARQRQGAVRELSQSLDLRERVALLGQYVFQDVPAESFDLWLDAERSGFAPWIRWTLALLTAAWICVGAGGLLAHGDRHALLLELAAPIALQGVICLWLQQRVRGVLEAAQRLTGQTSILRAGLKVMREHTFTAERLVELQRQAEGEDRALGLLERYLMVLEQRPKEWFYPLSVMLCLGTHAAISLDEWRRQFDRPMRRWLDAWAEFDALLALATYAAEHGEDVYPEIVDGIEAEAALFEAEGLVHPLLRRGTAVANDVSLGREVQFLLVSGSNMAGKSTLLRAIGANAVLALAGAPVAARRLRMSALRIGASLAINDSLAEGKSKFLAEVERLRDVLALAREHPGGSLFLIDEIFGGTNSSDRQAATEAVLRGLVAAGAIGALSTHDLALTKLAEIEEMHGENVHMASPDEKNPLGFDYLLKPGVNRTANALAIVRMMGLAG